MLQVCHQWKTLAYALGQDDLFGADIRMAKCVKPSLLSFFLSPLSLYSSLLLFGLFLWDPCRFSLFCSRLLSLSRSLSMTLEISDQGRPKKRVQMSAQVEGCSSGQRKTTFSFFFFFPLDLSISIFLHLSPSLSLSLSPPPPSLACNCTVFCAQTNASHHALRFGILYGAQRLLTGTNAQISGGSVRAAAGRWARRGDLCGCSDNKRWVLLGIE